MGERNQADEPSLMSTASLLLEVRTGNKPALEELAGRYRAMLGRWAHGRLPRAARDLVDTEDIVQSTIRRALSRIPTFEPRGEGAFLGYLRQILMNKILDEVRRAKRRPQHVELDPDLEAAGGPSPLEEAIGRDRLDRYEAALGQLAEKQREALILRLEMGMRYRDIAEALELQSSEAARAIVGRGMVRVARAMRKHHE